MNYGWHIEKSENGGYILTNIEKDFGSAMGGAIIGATTKSTRYVFKTPAEMIEFLGRQFYRTDFRVEDEK